MNSSGPTKPTILWCSFPAASRVIRVGVHLILKSIERGFESNGTLKGMMFFIRKSATFASGYVTASICWQPIQPGLKKSSRIGASWAFADFMASSIDVIHLTA